MFREESVFEGWLNGISLSCYLCEYLCLELTFLETELVGQIDQNVLNLFLGKRNVRLLGPSRLSWKAYDGVRPLLEARDGLVYSHKALVRDDLRYCPRYTWGC